MQSLPQAQCEAHRAASAGDESNCVRATEAKIPVLSALAKTPVLTQSAVSVDIDEPISNEVSEKTPFAPVVFRKRMKRATPGKIEENEFSISRLEGIFYYFIAFLGLMGALASAVWVIDLILR